MPALLPKQHAAHATLANLALALTLASTFLSHTELQSVSAATTQQHATQDCQPATCYAPGGISLSRGRRARMEDRVVCNPQLTKLQDQVLSLYVVLDGHEGHAASEFAARRLPEALKQHLHQARLNAAGGRVEIDSGGKARLQGELAVSRAIGDLPYRQHGLISEPEFSHQQLSPRDHFLVLASDGVFESLDEAAICGIAQAVASGRHYPPHLHMDADGQPRPHLPAPRFLPALWDPQLQMSQRMLDSVPVDHQALPPLPGVEDMSYIDAQTAIVQRGSSELLPNSAICGAPRHDGLADAGFSGTSQDVGVDGTCTAADQNVPQLGPAQNALVRVIGALPLEQRNMAERLEFWQHRYRQGSLSSAPSLLDHPMQAGGWGSPYNLEQQFARGGFGEVWRAVLRPTAAQQAAGGLEPEGPFVMKRMMTEHGEDVRLSGLREAYFGNLLRQPPHLQATGPGAAPDQQAGSGYDHLVRFMESFEAGTDLWLVFRDEGTSLHSLMYSSTLHTNPFPDSAQPPGPEGRAPGGGGVQMLQPSAWWWRLRQASEGEGVIRDLLFQLIKGLEVLHAANITHRDIKPENLLLQPADLAGDSSACNLRIIDFGSAVDPYSIHHLYGPEGPSDAQQTFEYAPPEAVLGRYWQGTPMVKRTWPYDMWSVGICWLELLMGTPHVFQISAKTRALLHHHLHLDEKSEGERTLAYLLRGYMELCIYPPRPFTRATPPNEPPAQPGQPPGAGTTSAARWRPGGKTTDRPPDFAGAPGSRQRWPGNRRRAGLLELHRAGHP
ncbi:hypothetical protein WJX72_003040 [[Myrmecia] bisecta]|uniref:Uncharacterized protein n=1 Tax=[Myrmecia] bisecta TaxID=41462 RepID=A0AAW1Q590_9CHLO